MGNTEDWKVKERCYTTDRDLHARSPSGLLGGSPLIRAASSSAKEEEAVFWQWQEIDQGKCY